MQYIYTIYESGNNIFYVFKSTKNLQVNAALHEESPDTKAYLQV